MRPNWFVALRVQAPLALEAPEHVRPFGPDDLHLTLAFLGAVEEPRARAAWDATVTTLSPRTIALGRVVPLGASALSALVDDPEIAEAMGASRDAIHRAAGVALEGRAPLPHVTVARVGRRADRASAIAWASTLELGTARTDELALYTWAEDRRTHLFRIVERRALER